MPTITDPADALPTFEEAFRRKELSLVKSSIHRSIRYMADEPKPGVRRLTYAKIDGSNVVGIAMYFFAEFHEGRPCFQVGLAIAERYRGQGFAKQLLRESIEEFRHGMTRTGVLPAYVEAVVGRENEASLKVTSAVFETDGLEVADQLSGLPAYHFIKLVEPVQS